MTQIKLRIAIPKDKRDMTANPLNGLLVEVVGMLAPDKVDFGPDGANNTVIVALLEPCPYARGGWPVGAWFVLKPTELIKLES